jgi:hypothetical protein
MAERRNIRLLVKHRNEMELSYRNWVSAVLELLIGSAPHFSVDTPCIGFMTRFGE